MHNCSLQNTTKALLINKTTLTQVFPMVSEVLCGMDLGAVNQVLVHLLHFLRGVEEQPSRTKQEDSGQLLLFTQTSTVNSLLTETAKCCPAFCSAFLGDSQRHCRVQHSQTDTMSWGICPAPLPPVGTICVWALQSQQPTALHLPLGALLCFPTQTTNTLSWPVQGCTTHGTTSTGLSISPDVPLPSL